MLAQNFIVIDPETSLYNTIRPLLDSALQLDREKESYAWHGWRKESIEAFLRRLPAHCALLVGVWDAEGIAEEAGDDQEREVLALGCVCEVHNGEICSLRTFEALTKSDPSLPAVAELEPGYQHAVELMRATRRLVAPVAWALFTDRVTWNEWLFAEDDKDELLVSLAKQGRCVLMGSQTSHPEH
jgi:hypothetical protein